MGLYLQLWFKRHATLSRWLVWWQAPASSHSIETRRESPPALTFTPLEQAAIRTERAELVRLALAKGIPLSQLEQHLDWLDANQASHQE